MEWDIEMEHFDLSDPERDLLMWDMVKALGVDLPTAVRCDEVKISELHKMLHNCDGCPEPGLCQIYLEIRENAASKPPSYCVNRKRLALLRETFPAPRTVKG